MSLSREQILAAQDMTRVEVAVPEWGGSVFVRTMSGTDRDAFERFASDQVKEGNAGKGLRAYMVSLCAVDDSGAHLFTADDVAALTEKNGAALERIATAAMTLNKLLPDSVEAAAKN